MKKTILAGFLLILIAITVSAGSFEFKGSTDKMSINEEMGDVLEAVTTTHLSDIKSGTVNTKEGTTKYVQYIRFRDTTTALNTSVVQFTKTSETDEVGDFLVVHSGTAVTDAFFEWHISFDEGLKSKTTNARLDGLQDSKISMLNEEYTFIDSSLDSRKVKLTLAKGAISDLLRQEEKKIYTIGDKSYEIEVTNIEVATKKAKFKVNGKETQQLQKGDIEAIEADVSLGISDIIPNNNDPRGSAVKLFLGASVLELVDENYEDDSFTRDVNLNKVKLDNAFIKVSASLIGDVLKISNIKYRLTVPRTKYVKAGEGVKKYLVQPQALLADWDIRYTGLENVAVARIKLLPSTTDDEYRLEFTAPEDKLINIPFLSNKNSFKLGDSTKDLIVVEGASATDFNIDKYDYFVLTTANTKNGKTYVLTYDSLNNETNTIIFTEVGGTQRSITYSNSSNSGTLGEGTLSIGAITAKFYIEEALPNRLAIDLNGDNDVASDQMDVVAKGGGVLDMGTTNSPVAPFDLILTTDGTQFEESTTSETLTFSIQTSQTTRIGISDTIGGLTTVRSSSNHVLGISNYGVKADLTSSADKADALTIDYPLSQVFAKVMIDAGTGAKVATSVAQSTETQCSNGKQDADETGVDCGGSCSPCPTCADNLKNQGEAGIDCGGPCPKICSAEEEQSQACDGCLQILEKGKKSCLSFGTIVGKLYCDKAGLLVPLKKNGESCLQAYECKSGRCEEGKCGRKMTPSLLLMNGAIILLVLIILYYVFALLK